MTKMIFIQSDSLTLIWSRRAVARLVCMSIFFFLSISSGKELRKGGDEGVANNKGGGDEGVAIYVCG